jgi:hypothetical protein
MGCSNSRGETAASGNRSKRSIARRGLARVLALLGLGCLQRQWVDGCGAPGMAAAVRKLRQRSRGGVAAPCGSRVSRLSGTSLGAGHAHRVRSRGVDISRRCGSPVGGSDTPCRPPCSSPGRSNAPVVLEPALARNRLVSRAGCKRGRRAGRGIPRTMRQPGTGGPPPCSSASATPQRASAGTGLAVAGSNDNATSSPGLMPAAA